MGTARINLHKWVLVALLSCFSLLQQQGFAAQKIIIDGSTGVKPLVASLVKSYGELHPTTQFQIGAGLNPQARIQALVQQDIDIAMASHGIDIQQISKRGLRVHRTAKVAIIIGVHHRNKITSISDQQLCDIYSGKITNWQSLGGQHQPIVPFTRPRSEVDFEVLTEQILCFAKLSFASNIQLKHKSGEMASALAQTSGAIGMTTLVRVAQSEQKIRVLSLNGIEPNVKNLQTGVYPLSRDMFLITASKPSTEVAKFLTFVRSNQGANIIRSNSAVPAK